MVKSDKNAKTLAAERIYGGLMASKIGRLIFSSAFSAANLAIGGG